MKPRPPKVFRPDEQARLTGAGLTLPPGPRRPRRAMVARPLMRYRYVGLAGVPQARRGAAVRAQLSAWSPFGESAGAAEYRVWEFQHGAGLFAWDAARMQERLREVGGRPLDLVPDSTFIAPPPGGGGVRLVQGVGGFEAQHWREGALVASRAYGECPDEAEWLNFQRGVGVDASGMRPVADALARPTPWTEAPRLSSPELLEGRARRREQAAVMVTSLLLMAASAVIARQYWDISRRTSRLSEELVRTELAARANRQVRDQALSTRQQVDTLIAALSRPNPLIVIDHLATHLPSGGTEIQDLSLDGRDLRVVLKAPANIAREAVVKNLESGGLLADVREARDSTPSAVALTMKVVARTDVAPESGLLAKDDTRPDRGMIK